MEENPDDFWRWFYEEHAIDDALEAHLFEEGDGNKIQRNSRNPTKDKSKKG